MKKKNRSCTYASKILESDCKETSSRPLTMEVLEPRVLFSGSPAPAEPAPAAGPAAQEASAPAEGESAPAAAEDSETAVAAPPAATENAEGAPAAEGDGTTAVVLTQEEVAVVAEAAVQRWVDSGLSDVQTHALVNINYSIGELGAGRLASADGNNVTIDADAAGLGWFVDSTPDADEEFGGDSSVAGVDLLTAILHEQGHVLGVPEVSSTVPGLMHEFLGAGERRLPGEGAAASAVAGDAEETEYLTVLGTGTGALLGNDLFDQTALHASPPTGDARIFDNNTGSNNEQCCTGVTNAIDGQGQANMVILNTPVVLTHWTIASGHDAMNGCCIGRNPDVFFIQGSNDGNTWTNIFEYNNDGTHPFSANQQVILYQGGGVDFATPDAYTHIRYFVDSTITDNQYQLAEVELFGIAAVDDTGATFEDGPDIDISLLGDSSIEIPIASGVLEAGTARVANSVAATLNDGFAYDPANPTGALPDRTYSDSPNGFHRSGGVTPILTYTFAGPVTLSSANEVAVDLYGRGNCCQDRDDNMDILFFDESGTVVGTLTGVGIFPNNSSPNHGRFSTSQLASSLADGTQIGGFKVTSTNSNFTIMEARAAKLTSSTAGTGQDVGNDLAFGSVNTTGTLGSVTITDAAAGTISYDPNGQFEYLSAGVTATDTFTYTVSSEIPSTLGTYSGRYIKVENNGFANRDIAIGEIEAFTTGIAPAANFDNTNDLALTSKGASVEAVVGSGGHGSPDATIDGSEQTGGSTFNRVGVGASIIIDLGSTQDLERIRIHQRNDCCYERLENFTVSILADDGGAPGDVVASTSFDGRVPNSLFSDITFPKRETDTATVTVTVTGENDAPTAVDDSGYGVAADGVLNVAADDVKVNLALGGTATQSSEASGGVASRAIDGNTNGSYPSGSVTHTAGGAGEQWWQVQLDEGVSSIDEIVLHNRTDCCQTRLSNFTVAVYNGDPGAGGTVQFSQTFAGPLSATSLTIPVDTLVYGDYVRVSQQNGQPLSLAEVQVNSFEGVLANDTDPDSDGSAPNDTLIIVGSDTASANGAAVAVNDDGSFTYDPTGSAAIQALSEGEVLTDTFTYTISDADPATGRFIMVQNNGTASRRMDISEIEAFGPGVIPRVDDNGNTGVLNPGADYATAGQGASVHSKTTNQPHGGNDDDDLIDGRETEQGNVWSSDGVANFVIIDLGQDRDIGSVRIHQRSDGCCQDRLSDFTVSVLADDGTGNPGAVVASQVYSTQPPNRGFAELVFPAVSFGNSETATVSVQVTGVNDAPTAVDDSGYEVDEDNVLTVAANDVKVNLALGGTATQSSEASGGVASRAIDGNTNGSYPSGSVTHTAGGAGEQWWQVQLDEGVSSIDEIVLHNRTDCCQTRLSNFTVAVYNGDPGAGGTVQFSQTFAGPLSATSLTIPVDTLVYGDYVRVSQQNGQPLSLAEVQVNSFEGVLANDTDPDSDGSAPNDTLIIVGSDTASANGAAVAVNDDGSFTYDPTGSAAIQALSEGEVLTDTFTYTISDADPATGRFIMVQNNGTASRRMDISEIEAFGPGVIPRVDDNGNTGVLNPGADYATAGQGASVHSKTTNQPHGGNDDDDLIDGRETEQGNVWSSDGVANFVIIDLGQDRDIGSVRIHQRSDGCCQDRLSDFTVSVLADDGTGNPGAVVASQVYSTQPPNRGFAELEFPAAPFGNSETATVSVVLTGLNDAPTFEAGTEDFNDVAVNDFSNDGDTVGYLLDGSTGDVDDSAPARGIAIVGESLSRFEYLDTGDTTWKQVDATAGSALLLLETDRVRYVPDGSSFGTETLTYRAWDQFTGLQYGRADLSVPGTSTGGTSAFSAATASSDVTVANVVIDTPGAPGSGTLTYGAADGEVNHITVGMVGGNLVITDQNGNPLSGQGATGSTVTVDPSDFEDIVIDTGDADDTITVGDMTGFTGSLTVLGGAGFDEVVIANGTELALGTGVSDGGADESLLVDGETFKADLDSSVSVVGDGTIDITAAGGVGDFAGLNLRRASLSSEGGGITLTGVGGDTGNTNDGVVLTHGSTVSTGGGGVTITGTATSTTGANDGISLKGGSDITAGGAGGITLTGTSSGVNSSYGVQLFSGTEVTTMGGDIAIVGSSAAVGSRNAGIYTNGATVTAGGAGSVAMTGTGGGAGSNNNGLSLAATAVDAGTSGDVTLVGMGGGGTSGNGGVQVGTRTSVSADGGNVTITGTGGAGTGVRNTGVSLLSGSSVSSGGDTEITGVAGTGTSRNGGVSLVSSTVSAAGDLTVDGTGNGTGSYNSGISSSRSTLGGADVMLAGTGSTSSTTGRFNDGVSISRGGVTASGTLTIDAAGGTGSRDNRGLMVNRAALGGTLALTGSADTDSGSRSTGVFIQNSVLSDDGTIAGTGGGVDGADGFGVYMRNITGGANLGVTTAPDTDEEKGGNYFDAVLPAMLVLGAGAGAGAGNRRKREVLAGLISRLPKADTAGGDVEVYLEEGGVVGLDSVGVSAGHLAELGVEVPEVSAGKRLVLLLTGGAIGRAAGLFAEVDAAGKLGSSYPAGYRGELRGGELMEQLAESVQTAGWSSDVPARGVAPARGFSEVFGL